MANYNDEDFFMQNADYHKGNPLARNMYPRRKRTLTQEEIDEALADAHADMEMAGLTQEQIEEALADAHADMEMAGLTQ